MILTGPEIKKRVENGEILISEFDDKRIGPNSYNLRLHNELLVYTGRVLDMQLPNATERITIPENGLVLRPGRFYLGRTVETVGIEKFVGVVDGRSSLGRLGLFVHVTAGFLDSDFTGKITLEITPILPIRIYPNIEICQVRYHTALGDFKGYQGKYQGNDDIQASMLYKELQPNKRMEE